jgi:hypothetical protein
MDTTRIRTTMLFLMCGAFAQGCSPTTAPQSAPAPQTVSGMTRDRTSYTFLKWDNGLAVMLVDQCDAHQMSGSSSNGKPDQRNGDAHRWDKDSDQWKVGYEWQLETADGQTATFTINNVEYDLSKGAVFRIDTGGDETAVTQIHRDLSKIPPNRNACDHFVASTSELKKPTNGTDAEQE